MKSCFFALVFFWFFGLGGTTPQVFAQKLCPSREKEIQQESIFTQIAGKYYTSEQAECSYRNGKLTKETPLVAGKKEGLEKQYDENGNLQFESPYVAGKLEGVQKTYYPNGQLCRETPYSAGNPEGLSNIYYEN